MVANSQSTQYMEARAASSMQQAEPSKRDSEAAAANPWLESVTAERGPLALYKKNRLAGVYREDERQQRTVEKLQQLYEELERYYRSRRRPSGLTMLDNVKAKQGRASWWQGISSMLDGAAEGPIPPAPRGLYMFGGVGTGKTMLMDLLVESAPAMFKLRRTTFHDFMLEVHGLLHRFAHGGADPLARVAAHLRAATRVLALDEFQVTDVADAVVLSRLFGQLWDRGLVLVATSNRVPEDLYYNGLQRDLFLPFIGRLRAACVVHDIGSATDYRRLAHHAAGTVFTASGGRDDPGAALRARFADLAAACRQQPGPASVPVAMGRTLAVPAASGNICMFSFKDLCGRPLAAADYIALAGRYHTLCLEGVPIFTGANRTEAYRFLALVDVLYENRIRLYLSAAGPPQDLFAHILTQADARSPLPPGVAEDSVCVDDNLAFAKERCISRLTEMQSLEYKLAHARAHSPVLLLALQDAQQRAAAEPEMMAA